MMKAEVEQCPNCGAPLSVDSNGLCTFCRAKILSGPALFSDVPATARKILRLLDILIGEPAAKLVLERDGLSDSLQTLTDALLAAGKRVREEGLVLDEKWVDIKIYKPEEVWTFNLATDVIAMLASVPNLPKVKRVAVRKVLVSLDAGLGTHWCRSTIGNAKPGPQDFQQLREAIPHRKLLRR